MTDDLEDGQEGDGSEGNEGSGANPPASPPRTSRAKPLFSEEQNRWIGARIQREEDKRRAVEGERDTAKAENSTLQGRVTALEQDIRNARAENAVTREAVKLKAENPEIVFRLVKDDLKFDDDGKPKDVPALLEQFKKDYPKYFGVASSSGADGSAGNDDPKDGSVANLNAWLREQAGKSKTRTTNSRGD